MPHDFPVYIIDDEPEMCRSLSLLLATGGVPARSFGSADLFLDMIEALPVGIIICDVLMPGTTGIEFVRRLPDLGRDDPVIVIAGHADVPLAVKAMKVGAFDFLEKPFDGPAITSAIKKAKQFADERSAPAQNIETLSPREREVLTLITMGATSKEAARQLGISPRTIETYRTNLMEKTGATNLAQLIRLGLEANRSIPASVPHVGSGKLDG